MPEVIVLPPWLPATPAVDVEGTPLAVSVDSLAGMTAAEVALLVAPLPLIAAIIAARAALRVASRQHQLTRARDPEAASIARFMQTLIERHATARCRRMPGASATSLMGGRWVRLRQAVHHCSTSKSEWLTANSSSLSP